MGAALSTVPGCSVLPGDSNHSAHRRARDTAASAASGSCLALWGPARPTRYPGRFNSRACCCGSLAGRAERREQQGRAKMAMSVGARSPDWDVVSSHACRQREWLTTSASASPARPASRLGSPGPQWLCARRTDVARQCRGTWRISACRTLWGLLSGHCGRWRTRSRPR